MPRAFLYNRKIALFLGVCFLVALFLLIGLGLYLVSPVQTGQPDQLFRVEKGLSLSQVAEKLSRKGLIRGKPIFLAWARAMGYSERIKSGEYRLNPRMSPLEVLNKLTKGQVITHSVTIPEGYTVAQIATLLDKEGLVDKEEFISLTRDPEVLERYGIQGPSLEGYLYPDTYRFATGLPPSLILDAMISRFKEVIAPMKGQIEQLNMTLEEVVTLASIVEKETGCARERPIIASVFLNRLEREMRLESDPTVIYGMADFDGNLKRKDLSNKTPYNTYQISGLPPGPIANPGIDAIRAVVNPADTDYLYFVSRNDGTHYFSESLSEHNRAVQTYQK